MSGYSYQEEEDYADDFPDHCDHEDAELAPEDSRWECHCGYRWTATDGEVERYYRHLGEPYPPPPTLRERVHAVRHAIANWWRRIWRQQQPLDDDIPF